MIPDTSSVPSKGPLALSSQINAASRATHLHLNRLITARLPLALPPSTTDPSLYIIGLLHIAPIYITFESLWAAILDAPLVPTALNHSVDGYTPGRPLTHSPSFPIKPTGNVPPEIHGLEVSSKTHSLLANVRHSGLLRSGRLRTDLQTLTGTTEHEIEEALSAIAQNGHLATFLTHIRQFVSTKPHTLLAYAWVLYMALFSGGRHIRATLLSASPNFWIIPPSSAAQTPASPSTPLHKRLASGLARHPTTAPDEALTSSRTAHSKDPALLFLNFEGPHDGDDIKADFKARFAAAEAQLTSGEKDDIVAEAQQIFSFMVKIVAELDGVCGTADRDAVVPVDPFAASRDGTVESLGGDDVLSGAMLGGRRLSMSDWDGVLFLTLTSIMPVVVVVLAILAWRYFAA